MAATTPIVEKPILSVPVVSPGPPSNSAIVDKVLSLYGRFQERRATLGLSNPGTVDNISKEVTRDVFLTNQTFSGLRAELNKSFSINPLFQVSHAFAAGSQQLSPYTFLALFGTSNTFCQAQLDSDLSLSARFNQRITDRYTFKSSVQIQKSPMGPSQAHVSLDQEYVGDDFTASLKSINPSILDGKITGMFAGSYLQSITPRLSLGTEAMWQRQSALEGPDTAVSYAGRYKGDDWIATAQLMPGQGSVQGTYWRRLGERVEAGVDLNLAVAGPGSAAAMMGGPAREGSATVGAKWEFSRSIFRAQVDSKGRVGCLLEKIVLPPVRVTFAGEIDHAKSAAKLGLAVAIEASSEEVAMQQETTSAPSIPF